MTAVFRGVSTDSLSAASTFHFGAQDWREAMISKDWETGGNLIPHSTGKYSRMVVTWQFVRPAEVRLLGRLQKYSCPECVFLFSVRIREISACISNYLKQCTSDTNITISHSKPFGPDTKSMLLRSCFNIPSHSTKPQGDPPIQDLINNECANALADGGGLKVRVVSEAPTVPWSMVNQ